MVLVFTSVGLKSVQQSNVKSHKKWFLFCKQNMHNSEQICYYVIPLFSSFATMAMVVDVQTPYSIDLLSNSSPAFCPGVSLPV